MTKYEENVLKTAVRIYGVTMFILGGAAGSCLTYAILQLMQ